MKLRMKPIDVLNRMMKNLSKLIFFSLTEENLWTVFFRIGRYIIKLQSLFLYQFDPIRDFSLETIFYTLPKLSLIVEDEYLSADWFIEISKQFHFTFPISVHNTSTILEACQAGIWRLTGKKTFEIDWRRMIRIKLLEKRKQEEIKMRKHQQLFNIKQIHIRLLKHWMIQK